MLSPRLAAAAAQVLPGRSLIDVGTDHAYVPVMLVKNGVVPTACASDVNTGPVERASACVQEAGLSHKIAVKKANGLQGTEPGEYEQMVMAGMGGILIKQLLQDSFATAHAFSRLILQPMNNSAVLRQYLAQNGFKILYELRIPEIRDGREKIYEIIVCEPGNMSLSDEEIRTGVNVTDRAAFAHYLHALLLKEEKILAYAANAHTALSARRTQEAQTRIAELLRMIKEIQSGDKL